MNEIYPPVTSKNFQKLLATKLEFRYLENSLGLFPYQEFVRRYMSPFTPYKHLILYHSLGSGKSIATLSVAVDHYEYSGKKTYIITRGDSAENNFRLQIKKYQELTGKPLNKKMFSFFHYIQLSNMIRQMRPEEIKEFFSDKIVIMDEVHNLKTMDEGGTLDNICRGISLARESKFLFSTATPMINSRSEIESLLKLSGRYLPSEYTLEDVQKALSGILSYSSTASRKPRENVISNGIREGYYISTMTGTQATNYIIEHKKDIKDVYLPMIYTSLFCLPKNATGKNLNELYMYKTNETLCYSTYGCELKNISYKHYHFNPEFTMYLKSPQLDTCSALYKSLIDIITSTSKGKIFIYLETVHGSGIIVLNNILEAYGYELYCGGRFDLKKKRYTYCVGNQELTPNISDRIDGYNDYRNKYGEYVQILIGSKVIGESISLLNVRQFHFISHHWNESSLNQARGRVVREGSHDDLPIEEHVVDIYIHVSVLHSKHDIESIDEYKIRTSNDKSFEISQIIEVMKESAVDKHVYSPIESIEELDTRSFTALYAKSYTPKYISLIESLVPCLIDDYINIMKSADELLQEHILMEMTRNIIINNVPISSQYLRASPTEFYFTTDPTSPFYDFQEYICNDVLADYENVDICKFRSISFQEKIKYLEESFVTKNIGFLHQVPLLFLVYNNKYYHLLYYKDDDKAYKACIHTPSTLQEKTRIYDGTWHFVTNYEEEKEVVNLFKEEYEKVFINNSQYSFFGYISVIDNKTRIKRTAVNEYSDSRKNYRGRTLGTLTVREVKAILSEEGIDYDLKLSKERLIEILEDYMFDNSLFAFI